MGMICDKAMHVIAYPKVISYPPSQELLVFGVFRSCKPTLNGVPNDIVRMASCYYNMEGSNEYKFNERNAPWDPIVCYAKHDHYFDNSGDKVDEVFESLVYVTNGEYLQKENRTSSYSRWCDSKTVDFVKIDRQCHMLPLYHVKYSSHNNQEQHQIGEKVMRFVPRFGPNKFNQHRRIQRKWSAYYKLKYYV